jgi:outer membrane receptor protein involved in Fe transport
MVFVLCLVLLDVSPGAFSEEVTVTASLRREPAAGTASAVSVLTSSELAATAAGAADDALRQVPGFALFRRSGSRTANPTTQGATLRGLGGSGASRAAVLDDGLPLNDPFGGWVPWSRVPMQALDRIEVLRGGASSLYGTGALAGVVHLVRRSGPEQRLDVDGWLGGLESSQLAAFASGSRSGWNARLAVEGFHTGGYVAVREEDRGPVDTAFASEHFTADLTLERAGSFGRAFLRGAFFDEDRRNGTPLQVNGTRLWQAAAGLDHGAFGGGLVARAYAGHQLYRQDFSSVDEARAQEQLVRTQQVPSDAGGLGVHWTRPAGAHVLLVGAEAREVRGTSEEVAVTPGGLVPSSAGGRQRTFAGFAEDAWSPAPRWLISLGARWDVWRNDHSRQTSVTGTRELPARSESALSPRLAVRHQALPWLALTGSAYGAFRAPTLNELHRSFRVGNVVTLADPALRAERLRGAETGVLVARGGTVSARAAVFWLEVRDTIANVTLSSTPALVTRQRRNLGRIRSRGTEVEVEVRPGGRWVLSGSAALTAATVRSFPADPALEGLRVPQVARRSGSLQARYEGRRLRVSAQARFSGSQFEDDLNRLPLAGFGTLDLQVSYAPRPQWEVFAAVENTLDTDQEIGRTPVVTLAPPRVIRAGVRLRLARPLL